VLWNDKKWKKYGAEIISRVMACVHISLLSFFYLWEECLFLFLVCWLFQWMATAIKGTLEKSFDKFDKFY